MSIRILRTAIGAVALSLTLTPAWALQGGHQMAGMTPGSGGGAALCAQNSAGVTRTIDVVNGRLEDARQTNDASKLRASVADLYVVFAQMKTQLADCVALAGEAGGRATGNTTGMDHSTRQMAPGTPVTQPGSPSPAPGAGGGGTATAAMDHSKMAGMVQPKVAGRDQPKTSGANRAPMAGMDHSKMGAAAATKANPAEPSKMAGMDHSTMAGENAAPAGSGTPAKAAPAAAVAFTVRTDPAPPRSGKNDFEVTLKDADGRPIADAEVSLAFYMPPMPSMNMPEMRSAAQLTAAGNGVYKGSGTVGMSGDWDLTITAMRKGQPLGTKKVKLTAK